MTWEIGVSILLTAGVAGLLAYCDLDAVFDAPPDSLKRQQQTRLVCWWWGLVGVNAVLSIGLYLSVSRQFPSHTWDQWLLAILCGAGYSAVVRLKFTTIELNGQKVPLGLETFYESIKGVVHRRINRIVREWRAERCVELSQLSLDELYTQAIIMVGSDALLNEQQKQEARTWVTSTRNDAGTPDADRKAALALYVIAQRRF